MGTVASFIKDKDIFGEPIVLNFNKSGESHKTLIGGLGSLLVQGFMVMYIYIRFKMFIFNEADNNFTEAGVIDLNNNEELFDLRYNEMDLTMLTSMRF